MRYAVGIDPGPRNMGVCAINEDKTVKFLRKIDLFHYDTPLCINAIRQWCADEKELLDGATMIVVEKQFIGKDKFIKCAESLIIIETVIYTLYPDKSRQVRPMVIKDANGIKAAGNHDINKIRVKEAVEVSYPEIYAQISHGQKTDDICDAVLLAFYGLSKMNV